MKQTTLESLPERLEDVLVQAQAERILITRNGKPFAMVVGLDHYDEEDWGYMNSTAFWEMIRESRKCPTVPLEEVKERLLRDD